jgi:hypothetical protein
MQARPIGGTWVIAMLEQPRNKDVFRTLLKGPDNLAPARLNLLSGYTTLKERMAFYLFLTTLSAGRF